MCKVLDCSGNKDGECTIPGFCIEPEKWRATQICPRCGGKGHFYFECPNPK